MKVVVLSGGVGGARFTRGLLAALGPGHQVTVVVNTGDDMWLHGVRVCPDLDTVTYTLAGVAAEAQGWGRDDESHRVWSDLATYDLGWDWFSLGDLDLATGLARTSLLRDGVPLSEVTARIAARWGLPARLLPMSDAPRETHVRLTDGRLLHFEEWWVRHRAALPAVGFEPSDPAAGPAPGVLAAIGDADVVVLPPSNPVVSIGTILAVPGVRESITGGRAPVVGVSPVVGGAPVRGMADACLTVIGVEVSAAGVARHYGARHAGGLLDAWLVDTVDADSVTALGKLGVTVAATDTVMVDVPAATRIARHALGLVAAAG